MAAGNPKGMRARRTRRYYCLCSSGLLCRPHQHLSLTPNENIRYQLRAPYCDGTTHVISEPLDFIAPPAILVPKPNVNLPRFHGVFAPNIGYRAVAKSQIMHVRF